MIKLVFSPIIILAFIAVVIFLTVLYVLEIKEGYAK